MKSYLVSIALIAAGTIALADAKDDVKAAAKKVADGGNYTWVATTEIEGANWTPAKITGKAIPGGVAVITSERDGEVTTAVVKGEKGVLKTDDGWKTAEDLRNAGGGGGGGGRGGNRGAMLLRTRMPASEAIRIADKTKELKAADGMVSGDLTEEGAKELATLGRGRPGGQAPEAKNAKGSIRYWVKEGQLAKMQLKVSATVSVNGEDRDMARTVTYEIRDVGTTQATAPAEAKKALGITE